MENGPFEDAIPIEPGDNIDFQGFMTFRFTQFTKTSGTGKKSERIVEVVWGGGVAGKNKRTQSFFDAFLRDTLNIS